MSTDNPANDASNVVQLHPNRQPTAGKVEAEIIAMPRYEAREDENGTWRVHDHETGLPAIVEKRTLSGLVEIAARREAEELLAAVAQP